MLLDIKEGKKREEERGEEEGIEKGRQEERENGDTLIFKFWGYKCWI